MLVVGVGRRRLVVQEELLHLLFQVLYQHLAAVVAQRKTLVELLVVLEAAAEAGVLPVVAGLEHLGKEMLGGTLQTQDLHGALLVQAVAEKAQQAEILRGHQLLVLVELEQRGLMGFIMLVEVEVEAVLVVVMLFLEPQVVLEAVALEET